jgi:hypothetical protein
MVAMLIEAYPEAADSIPEQVEETLQGFLGQGLIRVHG